MNVKFGVTAKRINSTSTAFSYSVTLDCKLKENCSRHDPIFIVKGLSKSRHFNYCEWQVSDSKAYYYWITDVIYLSNDIQEVHCKLDPVGTFSDAIHGSTQYCVYADSGHWNEIMDDIRMTPEHEAYEYTIAKNKCFGENVFDSTGCIAITFYSAIPSASCPAGIHTGLMSLSNFRKCLEDLSTINWFNPTPADAVMELVELMAKVVQSFAGGGSWADNVYSCKWLPFKLATVAGTYRYGMAIGGLLADNVEWYEIAQNTIIKNTSESFDIGTYWSTYCPTGGKAFLRNPRFTSMQLSTASGAQSINTSSLTQHSTLKITGCINASNGDWALKVATAGHDGVILATASGCCGVDLMGLVVPSPDLLSRAVVSGYSVMANVAMNAVGAEFGASTGINNNQLIDNPITSEAPTVSLNGASPCLFLNDPGEVILNIITLAPIDIDHYTNFCNLHGYPCNKMLSLNGISGFVKCYNASVAPSGANDSDIAFINSCLNNGIYL